MQIQKVVSPKGIEAWLVEEHTLPLIAMQFGFEGGSAQDPAGKDGLAYFVSGMLDEGAGDIDSQAFQEKLEDLAIEMSFDATRDVMTGGLKTLTKNKDEAFRLLRLALTAPRMDPDAIDRVREQIFAGITIENEDPERVAANAFFAQVFAGHPYGSPTKGTLDTARTIIQADLKGYVKRNFARDNLHVAVVGDISAPELATALDDDFRRAAREGRTHPSDGGGMAPANRGPGHSDECAAIGGDVRPAGPEAERPRFHGRLHSQLHHWRRRLFLDIDVGSAGEARACLFRLYLSLSASARRDHAGRRRHEKRGGEGIDRRDQAGAGPVAANGPTPEELDNAKRYLTGSYALRFSSSAKIADILLWLQLEGLGIDYIDKRNQLIDAVTLDDVKRVSKLIKPDDLVITIVGQPEGLLPAGEGPRSPSPCLAADRTRRR